MINSQDFDAVFVQNSNTEFVIVARKDKGFVPVIVSENCSLGLMGFAASKGNSYKKLRDIEILEDYTVRSGVDNYHELEIKIDDIFDSPVYFYWKGSMPGDKEDFLRVCKTSMRQLFRGEDNWSSSPQAFFWWNIGPMVLPIEEASSYQSIRLTRTRESKRLFESMMVTIAAVGALIGLVAVLGVSGDLLDLVRHFFSSP